MIEISSSNLDCCRHLWSWYGRLVGICCCVKRSTRALWLLKCNVAILSSPLHLLSSASLLLSLFTYTRTHTFDFFFCGRPKRVFVVPLSLEPVLLAALLWALLLTKRGSTSGSCLLVLCLLQVSHSYCCDDYGTGSHPSLYEFYSTFLYWLLVLLLLLLVGGQALMAGLLGPGRYYLIVPFCIVIGIGITPLTAVCMELCSDVLYPSGESLPAGV